jgi:hypothetical protein
MSRKIIASPSPAAPPFQRRPEPVRGLTSELIEAHLAAFMAAGGTVEVLSTTPMLKRIGGPDGGKPRG